MSRFTSYCLLLFVLVACSKGDQSDPGDSADENTVTAELEAGPFSGAALESVTTITGDKIREVVAEIASDEYQGRGPGSAGDKKARDYISQKMADLGFEPGASDGSWEQPFDLIGINATQPATWVFESDEDALALKQGTEFIVGSGVQEESSVVENAELIFVGYGIEAPEYEWDDFKGMDLTGKVLVMLNNDPDWDESLFAGNRRLYYGRWSYKYESAARQGAAGAIIIHTTPSAGYPWQVVQTSWSGEQFELPAGEEPRLQIAAWVTDAAAEKMMESVELDLTELVQAARHREFKPVPLGLTTSIRLENQLTSVASANVLALLPGSDPELKDEVVVYTTHHDHLGVGLPNFSGDSEDRIYNGARDNASGVGVTMAIAEAYKSLPTPPRRSILFAFVGAEEQGLLGSKYFARFPTFHPGEIAANVNFDSGNIWGETKDITYIGLGKSSLDDVTDAIAKFEGRVVKGDQFPDRGYFYRSDQFSLARIGVPALYLSGGTEFVGRPEGWGEEQINAYTAVNYHQPSDELTADWNFDGMEKDARFGFWAGLIVANADEKPTWNKGDEFEATRLKALAEAEQE